mmetsp:Transcript_101769/g.265432  ORF Transcript_101769/g.265432 Transcript_101769/m.265432 type:complete len:537 (-) Transcript_101769:17-1627(-)
MPSVPCTPKSRYLHLPLLGCGPAHVLWLQVLSYLGTVKVPQLHNDIRDRPLLLESFGCCLCALFVSDVGQQSSDDPNAVVHHLVAALAVRCDTRYAPFAQDVHASGQNVDRGKELIDDHRLHHVEFQLSRLGAEADGDVVPNCVETTHVHDLWDHWVHLARHDGGAWGHRWQIDLAQATAGSRCEQTQVVADFGDLHRHAPQDAREKQHGAHAGARLDEIVVQDHRKAGHVPQLLDDHLREVLVRRDACADRSAAQVGGGEFADSTLDALQVIANRGAVGVELLTQRHRHGILELCSAHLDYVGKLPSLLEEGGAQLGDRLHKILVHEDQGNFRGRGVGIVGGLALVDVVVWAAELVLALLLAEVLQGAVGDDLVGVHVGGGAGSTLHHVDQEVLAHQLPLVLAQSSAVWVDELVAGVADGVGHFLLQVAQLVVGLGAGLLHLREGDDELREIPYSNSRDVVALDGSQSLHTIICIDGHLTLSEEVLLHTRPSFPHHRVLLHDLGHECAIHRSNTCARHGAHVRCRCGRRVQTSEN